MELRFTTYEPHPEFMLYEDKKVVAQSRLDTGANAFRIKCFNTRRVFLIYHEMVRSKPVTRLVNEYNVPMASLLDVRFGDHSGTIELEGLRYQYRVNELSEIQLFRSDSPDTLLSCKLQVDEMLFSLDHHINYILFSLVWFMYCSAAQRLPAHLA